VQGSQRPSDYLNNYVFCYWKGKGRKLVVFRVAPPEEGSFFLKVYAKPEDELRSDEDTLDHVATFFIRAPEVKDIGEWKYRATSFTEAFRSGKADTLNNRAPSVIP
jgi:hypothetical protein